MGAKSLRRWIAALCFVAASAPGAEAGNTEALLAASWQPAFCESHSAKPECRDQTDDRFDASHFSLHGLWPMKRNYCGVDDATRKLDQSGDWSSLPALDLEPETRTALQKVMPGSYSDLHRHEWYKHGTCSGMTPEGYFSRSIELLEDLNLSVVADLFAANIGRYLSESEIRSAFVAAFGNDADKRVKMKCAIDGERRLISEITIGLSEAYAHEPALGPLIRQAGGTSFGCDGGIVDPAGLQ
ncbi:ribonuclease T2 family protein [Martelella soudanensis]|uniref:ribonuclease T2 family protein n=1 Tax=unclassified Martelella TaxID=2629616 RepID=UPI0015DFB6CC|nr:MULTISPECIES: ribonuclease T2 [unclassified Martelella]